MTQELTNRQNELKKEIETYDMIYSDVSMDDLNWEYYKNLKKELDYINYLLVHPEYV